MTFTYNGSPSVSDRDAVRFLVGDTVEAEHFLEDEEVEFLITQWETKGTMFYVASKAAESIATRLAREIDINADGQNLSLASLYDRYMKLAADLIWQHQDALVGGSSLYAGGMDAHESPDSSVAPLSFGTGMHDNMEAGQQDFGNVDAARYAAKRAQWGEEVP